MRRWKSNTSKTCLSGMSSIFYCVGDKVPENRSFIFKSMNKLLEQLEVIFEVSQKIGVRSVKKAEKDYLVVFKLHLYYRIWFLAIFSVLPQVFKGIVEGFPVVPSHPFLWESNAQSTNAEVFQLLLTQF